MIQNLRTSSMIVIGCCVIMLSYGVSFAQDVSEDLQHKAVDSDLLAAFIHKLGYKKYKLIKEESLHGIIFVVSYKKPDEIIKPQLIPPLRGAGGCFWLYFHELHPPKSPFKGGL